MVVSLGGWISFPANDSSILRQVNDRGCEGVRVAMVVRVMHALCCAASVQPAIGQHSSSCWPSVLSRKGIPSATLFPHVPLVDRELWRESSTLHHALDHRP